eukprot:2621904-Heterocapsa_arctica.AAC.1
MIANFLEHKWDPIGLYEQGYIPKHTKLKHLAGQIVNDRQRPDTFAEYDEKVQWKKARVSQHKESTQRPDSQHPQTSVLNLSQSKNLKMSSET